MPDHWVTIDLFIAPDGEFRHFRSRHRGVMTIKEALAGDGLPLQEIHYEEKVFRRYRLKIPGNYEEIQRIPTWPSDAWDNFLRDVIRELEAKGDAPWKEHQSDGG